MNRQRPGHSGPKSFVEWPGPIGIVSGRPNKGPIDGPPPPSHPGMALGKDGQVPICPRPTAALPMKSCGLLPISIFELHCAEDLTCSKLSVFSIGYSWASRDSGNCAQAVKNRPIKTSLPGSHGSNRWSSGPGVGMELVPRGSAGGQDSPRSPHERPVQTHPARSRRHLGSRPPWTNGGPVKGHFSRPRRFPLLPTSERM